MRFAPLPSAASGEPANMTDVTCVDFAAIARATPGYVGSDLVALTKEAAVSAIKRALASLFAQSSRSFDGSFAAPSSLNTIALAAPEALSAAQMADLYVTQHDFIAALPKVQPSATREGFATIPDITWADVGALAAVRAELEMAIVQPLRRPELFAALGLRVPAGVLLFGRVFNMHGSPVILYFTFVQRLVVGKLCWPRPSLRRRQQTSFQ
jgi:ribosome biogenesis ATPase